MPELGINSDKRQHLISQSDYDLLFEDYEKNTLQNNSNALLRIKEILHKEKRVALTCFEKNPLQCHRSRIANALMQLPNINYTLKPF